MPIYLVQVRGSSTDGCVIFQQVTASRDVLATPPGVWKNDFLTQIVAPAPRESKRKRTHRRFGSESRSGVAGEQEASARGRAPAILRRVRKPIPQGMARQRSRDTVRARAAPLLSRA